MDERYGRRMRWVNHLIVNSATRQRLFRLSRAHAAVPTDTTRTAGDTAPAAAPAFGLFAATWRQARKALATHNGQRRLAWTLVWALIVLDVLIIGQRALVTHWAYHSQAFDLRNMDQAVWNTLHGRPLRFTNRGVDWYCPPTRLGIHIEPIL